MRSTRSQNSHQVAPDGNRSVKQRRGWSSRNFSSSHIPLPRGTILDETQMMKRSMTGKPVLPMTMRKLMARSGHVAMLNEFMLSGVRVKPRSIKAECGVKIPHQAWLWPAASTMSP